jgi:hypothetical protein
MLMACRFCTCRQLKYVLESFGSPEKQFGIPLRRFLHKHQICFFSSFLLLPGDKISTILSGAPKQLLLSFLALSHITQISGYTTVVIWLSPLAFLLNRTSIGTVNT